MAALTLLASVLLPMRIVGSPAAPLCNQVFTNCNGTFVGQSGTATCYTPSAGFCCRSDYELGSCDGQGTVFVYCASTPMDLAQPGKECTVQCAQAGTCEDVQD